MAADIPHTHEDHVSRNGVKAVPQLSICIPAFRDNAALLLQSLHKLSGAKQCELIVYDDGSNDAEMTADIARWIYKYPGPARLITSLENKGRAFARNQLVAHAATGWILFLDADMIPDGRKFLTNYLAETTRTESRPTLIAGGFSLQQIRPTHDQALHAAQARRSECLTAKKRAEEPGRYIFTSNILVHKDILATTPFDTGFEGWGWEDVDWGLNVVKAWPVHHINNTATHLGLDDTSSLIEKYADSGKNFARLAARHPEAVQSMKLMRAIHRVKALPGTEAIVIIGKILAHNKVGLVPMPIRLFALKLFRAASYARYIS